jgi:pimeloyl-ACP methyl ester carboxylesterase
MSKVSINGVKIHYEQEGKGPPLVLITGYGTDATFWYFVRSHLARHFSLLMFDNRGTGHSDVPKEGWSVDQMADETVGLMDEMKLTSAHILGHSMGGAIAQSIAYRHPQRVQKAIFAHSLLHLSSATKLFLQTILQLHEEGVPMRLRGQLIASNLFSGATLDRPGFLDGFLNMSELRGVPSLEGLKGQCKALTEFDSRTWCGEIKAPSLVLCGDEDTAALPVHMHELAARLPHALLHTFHNCGHVSPVEQPEAFCEVVTQFLAS